VIGFTPVTEPAQLRRGITATERPGLEQCAESMDRDRDRDRDRSRRPQLDVDGSPISLCILGALIASACPTGAAQR